MGANDAAEMLDACKEECARQERKIAELTDEMHSRELHHFESEQKLEEAERKIAAVIAALEAEDGSPEVPDFNEWADRYRVMNALAILRPEEGARVLPREELIAEAKAQLGLIGDGDWEPRDHLAARLLAALEEAPIGEGSEKPPAKPDSSSGYGENPVGPVQAEECLQRLRGAVEEVEVKMEQLVLENAELRVGRGRWRNK